MGRGRVTTRCRGQRLCRASRSDHQSHFSALSRRYDRGAGTPATESFSSAASERGRRRGRPSTGPLVRVFSLSARRSLRYVAPRVQLHRHALGLRARRHDAGCQWPFATTAPSAGVVRFALNPSLSRARSSATRGSEPCKRSTPAIDPIPRGTAAAHPGVSRERRAARPA